MLRLNQNIPLSFFIDLKWASRGPVKAKSLLHGGAWRAWFGAVLQPAQQGWHSAPAVVNRLPREARSHRTAAGGKGGSFDLARSFHPATGRLSSATLRSSWQKRADLGLPGRARWFVSDHAFGDDRPGSRGPLGG